MRVPRGLTLAELVLALGLLGLVISTLLLLFLSLMSSSTKGSHLSTGVLEADRVLEALAVRAEQGMALPATLTGEDRFYAHDLAAPTSFTYDVTATQLENGPMGSTWWLKVTVRWWSQTPANDSRTGSGKLSVNRARMVYLPR